MSGLIISAVTVALIILSVLLFPTIEILGKKISTYWMIALIGAFTLIMTNSVSLEKITQSFTAETMNPVKILILFISMTILSIFLDEVGMFRYVAIVSARKFKTSQFRLFFGFYFLISFLTVFTSNDIIILTFTPFICYYTKHARINPVPYLVAEFVAANTWSMFLIIGNPTNIFLASAFNIDFVTYLVHMALPTLFASLVSLAILTLLFYRSLRKEMEYHEEEVPKLNKFLLIVGLIHLIGCTVLIAISSYIGLQMWLITFGFAASLIIITSVYNLTKKNVYPYTIDTLRRSPWNLIPFVISMFVIVEALNEGGFTALISSNLPDNVFAYGYSSVLAANLINNIPMSVLYSNIIGPCVSSSAAYATIISSNIAAFITPVGALAGIMWMSLLRTYNIKYSFGKFMEYGLIVGVPTVSAALASLLITI